MTDKEKDITVLNSEAFLIKGFDQACELQLGGFGYLFFFIRLHWACGFLPHEVLCTFCLGA